MNEINLNEGFNSIITYYKHELELKKGEISDLKREIAQLTKDNRFQMGKIEQLKFQNFKVKELYETRIVLEAEKSDVATAELNSQITKLNEEVEEMRQNKKQTPAKGLSNEEAFDYKQIQIALKELEVANYAHVELIERMQVFYNKMNALFNKKNGIVVDYKTDSMEQFKLGLMNIENGIYEAYGLAPKKDHCKQKEENNQYNCYKAFNKVLGHNKQLNLINTN